MIQLLALKLIDNGKRMNLKQVAHAIKITTLKGALDKEFSSIEFDSRKVVEKTLFVALRGTRSDGHHYIEDAIASGASIIIVEQLPERVHEDITYLEVPNSGEALGQLANLYYEEPSKALTLVGVTGTNGKTTTVSMLYELFVNLGYKVGLISTVHNRIGASIIPTTHTTPDALTLNKLLSTMVEEGCSFVFMEVSSHSTVQHRITGLHFTGAIFTNMSHDHLDYHKTFKAYIAAKKMFFDNLPENAFALVNIDDKRGRVMIQNTLARQYTYSIRSMADFRGRVMENSVSGLQLVLNDKEVFSRLIGDFNAYNLLAVYGAAMLLGQDEMEALTGISQLKAPEGRFEYVYAEGKEIIGIVDYAHTPDALEKVLQTIRQLNHGAGQVITVVGCGGDRDAAKRPVMAKVACDYSEQVILTSDNPRSESPALILEQMEAGIPAYASNKVITIQDRRQAIRTASRLAQNRDIILVAGKGHEKYQEINGLKHPFDDKAILQEALNG
jgi:UDP-N-acetylmuramoyl-L-alanyl-D-glutamate--2,6-diaminopimelate ligase